MEKDEFIRFLEKKGINAKLEDGVVMVFYDGGTLSPSAVYRKFNLAKKFAEENDYRGSLGIRKRSGKVHVEADPDKNGFIKPDEAPPFRDPEQPEATENFEQMSLFKR